MSNGSAKMSAPAIESSTMTILAIDLGKLKSVACRYDPVTGEHAYETIATTPPAVHDLLIEASPAVLVIEACSVCGWRQVSAYSGLVPKQYQSGQMNRLGRHRSTDPPSQFRRSNACQIA